MFYRLPLKGLKKLAKITFWFCLIIVLADIGFVAGFPKSNLPKNRADAGVVLGAAPGSLALKNRTEKGIELVESGKAEQLVLSGGKTSDKDKSEAEYMSKIVTQNHEREVQTILEGQSDNTWENMLFTMQKIGKEDSIIVITDRYHLARSVVTAKLVGFENVYWDSPDSSYYPKDELRKYYFREITALPWYLILWISGRRN